MSPSSPNLLPPDACEFRFVHSSGPGGQHVNKASTAVELRVEVSLLGLEIGAERQNDHNAKRITELAEEVGWVKSRRRIGDSRVNAFFPDRATPTPPEEADVRFLRADGVSRPF